MLGIEVHECLFCGAAYTAECATSESLCEKCIDGQENQEDLEADVDH